MPNFLLICERGLVREAPNSVEFAVSDRAETTRFTVQYEV